MRGHQLANYSVIFIAAVLLAIVLKTFQAVLRPLMIAVLCVFIMTPLATYARQKNIPVWLMFTGLFAIFILLLVFISSFITIEHLDLQTTLPKFQERIIQSSSGVLELASRLGFGMETITPDKLGKLAIQAAGIGLGAVRALFSEILLATILLMFVLQAIPTLLRSVENRFGQDEVTRLEATFRKIEGDILAYFSTKTAMSLGTTMGTGLVLLLFQAKYILISLLITFVLNFIPVIGSLVAVGTVIVLYLLSFGWSAYVVWLLIALMAVQFLFGNILEPKITGERLNLSPLLIMVSLYVWGWIWGVIGMLLSVPLTMVILIIIKHLNTMERAEAP